MTPYAASSAQGPLATTPFEVCAPMLWGLRRRTIGGSRGGQGRTWEASVAPEDLILALKLLRTHRGVHLDALLDVVAVDRLPLQEAGRARFEVIYVLVRYRNHLRLQLRRAVHQGESLPRVTPLYPSANWMEREVWDLYGIPFEGHPDLRRLYTDYGFGHHPLRKDFPLRGYGEVRYDADAKRVVREAPQQRASFRRFDFQRPWQGEGGPSSSLYSLFFILYIPYSFFFTFPYGEEGKEE